MADLFGLRKMANRLIEKAAQFAQRKPTSVPGKIGKFGAKTVVALFAKETQGTTKKIEEAIQKTPYPAPRIEQATLEASPFEAGFRAQRLSQVRAQAAKLGRPTPLQPPTQKIAAAARTALPPPRPASPAPRFQPRRGANPPRRPPRAPARTGRPPIAEFGPLAPTGGDKFRGVRRVRPQRPPRPLPSPIKTKGTAGSELSVENLIQNLVQPQDALWDFACVFPAVFKEAHEKNAHLGDPKSLTIPGYTLSQCLKELNQAGAALADRILASLTPADAPPSFWANLEKEQKEKIQDILNTYEGSSRDLSAKEQGDKALKDLGVKIAVDRLSLDTLDSPLGRIAIRSSAFAARVAQLENLDPTEARKQLAGQRQKTSELARAKEVTDYYNALIKLNSFYQEDIKSLENKWTEVTTGTITCPILLNQASARFTLFPEALKTADINLKNSGYPMQFSFPLEELDNRAKQLNNVLAFSEIKGRGNELLRSRSRRTPSPLTNQLRTYYGRFYKRSPRPSREDVNLQTQLSRVKALVTLSGLTSRFVIKRDPTFPRTETEIEIANSQRTFLINQLLKEVEESQVILEPKNVEGLNSLMDLTGRSDEQDREDWNKTLTDVVKDFGNKISRKK